VEKVISSVQEKEYNTKKNMQYSYAGYHLMEGYSILFVSKGMEQNIILFFPFSFLVA